VQIFQVALNHMVHLSSGATALWAVRSSHSR
jgi:hypothetical protein